MGLGFRHSGLWGRRLLAFCEGCVGFEYQLSPEPQCFMSAGVWLQKKAGRSHAVKLRMHRHQKGGS